MAPTSLISTFVSGIRPSPAAQVFKRNDLTETGDWRQVADRHPEDLVVESWSEGFMVGALIIMACITIANMRRHILLHKLVLLEQLLAMSHGTFCFMEFKGYGWYLSATAMLLYFSWIIHNAVAWMKVRPFFKQPGGFFSAKTGKWTERIYLSTLAMTVPVIIFEISNNYRFFNNRKGWYKQVRPYEPLMRDPWWVFTCLALFQVVRGVYGAGVIGILKNSPRFGILFAAIILAIIFTILDIVDSIDQFVGKTDGINPFWKLSLVFKCLTDTIMLDDFKTELRRLNVKRIKIEERRRNSVAMVADLDDFNESAFAAPSRNARDRLHSTVSPAHSQSKVSDSDDTMVQDARDLKEKDEDPLSEHAMKRDLRSQAHPQSQESQLTGHKYGTNSPSADLEEVEFATALATCPTTNAADGKPRSSDHSYRHRRHRIGESTRKLAKLPGLGHFALEAIKPGRQLQENDHHSHENTNGDGGEAGQEERNQRKRSLYDEYDSHSDHPNEPPSPLRTRNIHEEVMRNTIMELEAQKQANEARKRGESVHDGVRSREEERDEERRRQRWLRGSLGADSDDEWCEEICEGDTLVSGPVQPLPRGTKNEEQEQEQRPEDEKFDGVEADGVEKNNVHEQNEDGEQQESNNEIKEGKNEDYQEEEHRKELKQEQEKEQV